MTTINKSRLPWNAIRGHVAAHSDPRGLWYERGSMPHPRDAGARLTTTWPVGQLADYTLDGPPGEAPLTIREFESHWQVILDTARLTTQALDTVDQDPSKAIYLGAAILGGAIGSSMSNKREGMLLGAGLGLLFAAILSSEMKKEK